MKRFWGFLLEQEVCNIAKFCPYPFNQKAVIISSLLLQSLDGDMHWATVPKNHLNATALRLKQWMFEVVGKVCGISTYHLKSSLAM